MKIQSLGFQQFVTLLRSSEQHHAAIRALLLVNIFRDQGKRSFDHDFYIEPQRPVVDIVEVNFNPLLHLFNGIGFAAAAADLCQASNAGFDTVAGHIGVNFAGVIVVMGNCVRPWPH